MKKLCIIAIALLLLVPAVASGQDQSNYFSLKGGAFFPDNSDFEDGFTGELAVGHYFNPNLALEGGFGFSWIGDFMKNINFPIHGTYDKHVDSYAWYLTATVKGVLPIKPVELYAGAGAGLYHISAEAVYCTGIILCESKEHVGDSTDVLGVHLVTGIQLDLSHSSFVGIEGKYVTTKNVTLALANTTLDANVRGFSATAVLGLRF